MNRAKLHKIEQNTGNSAYDIIRRRIIHLEYGPGLNLDEKTLVEELGLSRTPVREALIRLSGEGLIDIQKNKGAKVSELNLNTLQSIFEAGDLIERAYTRLACLRRDQDDLDRINAARLQFEQDVANRDVSAMVTSNTAFHLRITEASRNKYFLDSYRRILVDHERIAQIWYTDNFNRDDQDADKLACQQHLELAQAIENRDAEAAEAVSIAHANACKEGIRRLLSSGEQLISGLNVSTSSF